MCLCSSSKIEVGAQVKTIKSVLTTHKQVLRVKMYLLTSAANMQFPSLFGKQKLEQLMQIEEEVDLNFGSSFCCLSILNLIYKRKKLK